jgi:hypothetical protein
MTATLIALGLMLSKGALAASAYERGVTLSANKEFNEEDGHDPKEGISIKSEKGGYAISVIASFSCGSKLEAPYVIDRTDRATLVLKEAKKLFPDLSECTHALSVKVADRLKKGQTLYVLAGSEVLGHFVLP